MSGRRSTLLVVACLCTLGLAAGCGGDSGVEPVTKPRASRPSPEARRAVADPESAAAAAIEYWQSIQRGAVPLSLSLYAPRVVEAVGLANFAGMLAAQRPLIREHRLNVIRIEDVAGGRLITAEALPKAGPKIVHSFFLRRQQSRWRLRYDTLTAAGIQQYVQEVTQRGIDPGAPPSARAARASDQVLEAYRRTSLSRADPTRDGGSPAGENQR